MGQIGQMSQMGRIRAIKMLDMTVLASLTFMTEKRGKVTGSGAEKILPDKVVDKQGRISVLQLQAGHESNGHMSQICQISDLSQMRKPSVMTFSHIRFL